MLQTKPPQTGPVDQHQQTQTFEIDPQIAAFEQQVYNTPLIQDVWKKYYWHGETHPYDAYTRVARAIGHSPAESKETQEATTVVFQELMTKRLFLPGGRILAGAGTTKHVTLMNCYVNGTLEDSIEGIADGDRKSVV